MKKSSNMSGVLGVSKKYTLGSFNFKNNTNYMPSMPQFFSNSILVQKFIFVIF
jgi:hypothetical protein